MKTAALMIFICLYVILLWGMLIYVWRKGYKEWRKNKDMRPYSIKAKILDKREIKNVSDESESWHQLVLFDIAGRQVEYNVDYTDYQQMKVGQVGMLNISDQNFQSFIVEKSVESTDDIYGKIVRS